MAVQEVVGHLVIGVPVVQVARLGQAAVPRHGTSSNQGRRSCRHRPHRPHRRRTMGGLGQGEAESCVICPNIQSETVDVGSLGQPDIDLPPIHAPQFGISDLISKVSLPG